MVGDTTGFLTEVPASEIGRWTFVAAGFAVIAAAWGPSAAANVRNAFNRQSPRLIAGDFVEIERDALGGPGLQVLGVEIFNELASGGERQTARAVVPDLEAFNAEGERVASAPGVWFPDKEGEAPSTVDFRPRGERHPLELAGKFPDASHAWLAGERDPPSLGPGIYRIRATLRGGNVHPEPLEWFLRNPGPGGELMASDNEGDLPPIPEPPEEPTEDGEEAAIAANQPSNPLEEVELLLLRADELEEELWERNARMRRSGSPLPTLGQDYLGQVRAWNRRVLALADAHLPAKEASYVSALAGISGMFPPAPPWLKA